MSKPKRRKRKNKAKDTITYEFVGILLLAFFIIGLPIKEFGVVGFSIHTLFRIIAGYWDFVLSLTGIYVAFYLMVKRTLPTTWTLRKTGFVFIFISIIMYTHFDFVNKLQMDGQYTDVSVISATWQQLGLDRLSGFNGTIEVGGGMLGAFFYVIFSKLFGKIGTEVMIITFIMIGVLLTFHFSYIELAKKMKQYLQGILSKLSEKSKEFVGLLVTTNQDKKSVNKRIEKQDDESESLDFRRSDDELIIHDFLDNTESRKMEEKDQLNRFEEEAIKEKIVTKVDTETDNNQSQDIELDGIPYEKFIKEEENYIIPPFKLLNRAIIQDQGNEFRDITNNAKKLEATLESFGVRAKVTQINRGPAVTRYEVQPDIGVKVSRIVNLSDDIALSLAAKDIRIEAPIPGKAAIGIEVPNSEVAIVTLREVLESAYFFDSKSKLSIALGRDIAGEPIIGDLSRMPHLLIAGATGSGKSVCVNGVIASILYKAKPSEVKFLMIDPKMVELNVYNGIPHLLTPVVTNPKKASKALKMVVNEMEKRYEKFAEKGARDIEKYNGMIRNESAEMDKQLQLLPYIVVIIDELADLMMVAPNDVEDAVIRIAQKARAAGIHLIVATQRPSVDVITGLIKANIPSRIAFGVSSQTDSRTILDMGGAEKLLGRGDMLYLPVGYSKPIRIQGTFISDIEVEDVVSYVKNQQQADYQEDLIPDLDETSNDVEHAEDEYFNDAVNIVLENNQASVSLLQRRLRIGYTRAARIVDEMEAKGIVGPYEGSKPRKVLITTEQFSKISG